MEWTLAKDEAHIKIDLFEAYDTNTVNVLQMYTFSHFWLRLSYVFGMSWVLLGHTLDVPAARPLYSVGTVFVAFYFSFDTIFMSAWYISKYV